MDRELVVRAQRGDHDAFERLAAASADRLVATATLILRDRDAARDAVQETLIEVWRSLPTLRDPDAFPAWLHRILIRACSRVRQSSRRQHVEVRGLEIDAPVRGEEGRIDDRDRIERAFLRMTEDQRVVLVLHHFVGLPLAESARAMQIPVGTMKSRLNRASAAFRAAVEADDRAAGALPEWAP